MPLAVWAGICQVSGGHRTQVLAHGAEPEPLCCPRLDPLHPCHGSPSRKIGGTVGYRGCVWLSHGLASSCQWVLGWG